MPSPITTIRPRKDALIAASAVFFITTFCNVAVSLIAERGLLHTVQHHLISVASIASQMTQGDLHQTLTQPAQKGSSEYLSVQAPYRHILAGDPELRYVYTMVLRGDKVHLVVDTKQQASENQPQKDERDTTANVMEEYPDATASMRKALAEKMMVVEPNTYSDEWGTFLSAYAPIYNNKKQAIGVVGVDMDANDFQSQMRSVWIAFSIGCILAIALSCVIFISVVRLRSRHLHEELIRLKRLEAMHDFQEQIRIVSTSLAHTSASIHLMAEAISETSRQSSEQTDNATNQIRGAGSRVQSIALVCQDLVSSTASIESDAIRSRQHTLDAVEHLRATDTASSNLTNSAQNISKVVTLITDITEKIDLLALNATIEAARAGEVGKGFAVVADEVKLLSQQTATATKQIGSYVSDIQQAAQDVVAILTSVTERVFSSSDQVAAVAQAIATQKELVSLIAEDIIGVTNNAQVIETSVTSVASIAHLTEEQTKNLYRAVGDLSRQNQSLKEQVADFMGSLRHTSDAA
jgi:methyl-accepting chemotaxis protein